MQQLFLFAVIFVGRFFSETESKAHVMRNAEAVLAWQPGVLGSVSGIAVKSLHENRQLAQIHSSEAFGSLFIK